MSQILPINLNDLLHQRSVESARVEFKASWDEKTTAYQVLKTVCAFANDYQVLNGGYIIIGVAEEDGRAVLPPAGINAKAVEKAQKWLHGRCKAMKPAYSPIFSTEVVEDRHILVVWAPASDAGAHRAPDAKNNWKYWIRIGPETVDAEIQGKLSDLLEQKTRVPWDDRVAQEAYLEDIRETKVREHLRDVKSGLFGMRDAHEIYRRMLLVKPVNEHEAPRNVALLFFSEDPKRWFTGANIEVVRFAADRTGNVQDEHFFRGPLADQVRDCLRYLEGFSQAHLQKERDRSQVRGWVNYPQIALREALVNAVYHRSYREDAVQPTKVWLHPDRIEIISYPGPVAGIEEGHLAPDVSVPPVPARNRRIAEFLKELRLAEGRLTGLPKIYTAMEQNGSPIPSFDFSQDYFRVTLPAHPEYAAVSAIQDAAYLRTVGSIDDAFERVRKAWEANRASAVLSNEMIRLYADRDRLDEAESVFEEFREQAPKFAVANVANTLIEALMASNRESDAKRLLADLSNIASLQDAIDSAILARRLGDQQSAHRYFVQAGDAIFTDSRALHEFAQTKMQLAQKAYREKNRDVNRRLLIEARGLLERVIQLDAPVTRHAWAWRDHARTLGGLRAPGNEVEAAYEQAIHLLPEEKRFADELNTFRNRRQRYRTPRKNGRRHRGRSG